jgi:large subunit ribosomal protein L5
MKAVDQMKELQINFHNKVMTIFNADEKINPMSVPRLLKIVINVGIGITWQSPKLLEGLVNDLALITLQQPSLRTTSKSIASFKLREGMKSSCVVTLRKKRMYNVLHKLISFNLPQIRNFRGLSLSGFDKRGSYTFGIDGNIIFPEIDYNERGFGLGITLVTSAKNKIETEKLLRAYGLPLRSK